ncbi:hypothetical protein AGMMS49949_04270 [Alphaproteobacteria bacterium]|nr:hypothetical protein AGMMS49949_04270 [Alphaproteobacteria bacterium]
MTMNFIGCDIGKKVLDVYYREKIVKFENKKEGIQKLIAHGKKVEKARIILEPTGGYERSLMRECAAHALLVSCVNPFYVRNFARSKRSCKNR